MSKLPLICILVVIFLISCEVDAQKRRKGGKGGRRPKETEVQGKQSDNGGTVERRKQGKRKCQCQSVVVIFTRCGNGGKRGSRRNGGNRKSCGRNLKFRKTVCDYPWSGSDDGSNSNGGTDPNDGTNIDNGGGTNTDGNGGSSNDGTGADDTSGSNGDTGSNDGSDSNDGTGSNTDGNGGLDVDGGGSSDGSGVDVIVLNPDGTETPEYVNQKCEEAITKNPPVFYLASASPVHFIHCDEHGNSWLMPCADGTVWCQLKLTCDHDDEACNA